VRLLIVLVNPCNKFIPTRPIAKRTHRVILCGVALFLIWESKKLLIGEAATPALRSSLHRLAQDSADVEAVERLLTMHMGPHSLLLNMDLSFRSGLDAEDMEKAVERLEKTIRRQHPRVQYVFIEADAIAKAGA